MEVKQRLAILAVVVLLAATVPVLAQGQGGRMPPPPQGGRGQQVGQPDPVIGMAGRALHELDLDRAQRDQIWEIVRAHMEGELGQHLRTLDEARRALERLVWDPEANDLDLIEAQRVVADAAEQMVLARRPLTMEILGALTDAQREQFLQMLAAEPQHPEGPGGQSGPGGPEGRRGPGPQGR